MRIIGLTWIIYSCCLLSAGTGWWLLQGVRISPLHCSIQELGAREAEKAKVFFSGKSLEQICSKGIFRRFWREQKQDKQEWEIGEAISYLRNAVAMGRGEAMSTGLILEELAELQGRLSPVYMRMLHYLRLNETEKLVDTFVSEVRSELAVDFSRLLLQWEELPPRMLVEALESHQKNIREVRLTKQKKRDEMISDFIYLPVIMNVMLVLVNFIYVAYFIDQREMLMTMFG